MVRESIWEKGGHQLDGRGAGAEANIIQQLEVYKPYKALSREDPDSREGQVVKALEKRDAGAMRNWAIFSATPQRMDPGLHNRASTQFR